MRSLACLAVAAGLVFGCSGDDDDAKGDAHGSGGGAGVGGSGAGKAGSAGRGTSGGAAGKGAGGAGGASGDTSASGDTGTGASSSAGQDNGGAPGGTGGSSMAGAGAQAGEATGELVPLPSGSREFDGIVNLVDADAAAALDANILDDTLTAAFLNNGLAPQVNLFLENYYEEYDFLFVFADHRVDGARFAGRFDAFNRPPAPGGGVDFEVAVGGYKGNGRLKGAIVIPYVAQVGPPLAHETLHYWADYLDEKFGFGAGLDIDDPVHWGYAGTNGQLGGFDPASIRCDVPSNASPPDCTPLGGGRTRYVTDFFGTYTNGFRDVVYSPFELYIMGLVPRAEAPSTIMMLRNADTVSEPMTTSDPLTIEADSLDNLPLADIVARHGEIELLPEKERAFSSAFVVISAEPAPAATLQEIAGWSAAFGNRGTSQVISSFETYTGGRATMNTKLGSRRRVDKPAPAVRDRFVCDLLKQDCANPDWACYPFPPNDCVLSDGVALDQPCAATFACAPGLICASGKSAPDDYVCKPLCDATTSTGAKSCDTLCSGLTQKVNVTDGTSFAFCVPP